MRRALLVLRKISAHGVDVLGERDSKRLEPAMRFAEALPLENPRELRWALSEMPKMWLPCWPIRLCGCSPPPTRTTCRASGDCERA